ncbi:MAG: DNA translocase FtsK, partial [Oscillospiraceae bacterium]
MALEKPHGKVSNKIWLTTLIIILVCTTVYIFDSITIPPDLSFFQVITFLYTSGVEGTGAGLLGGLIGTPLIAGMGALGAKIIIVLLLFVAFMLLTGTSLVQLYKTLTKPVSVVSNGIQSARVRRDEERKILEDSKIDIALGGALPVHPVLSPNEIPPKMQDKKATKQKNGKLENLNKIFGISEQATVPTASEPVNEPDMITAPDIPIPEINFGLTAFPEIPLVEPKMKSENPVSLEIHSSPIASAQSATVTPVDASTEILENAAKAAAEFMKKKEEADKKEVATSAQMALYHENKDKEFTYCFPPLTFLATGKRMNIEIETEELQTNGKKLVETLKSFGVQTKIVDICRGPSVTRYELQPAAGVKISKITNLADDLALNLAATGVRIEAPIPGKAAVGVEIPNKNKTIVRMRELIESNIFATAKGKLTVALGRDIAGQVAIADLAKMPHLLIAGTTGSGKSVCINSLIISLMYKSTPDEVRFLMIDPKVVELGVYNGIPHLLVPVVTDPRKAAGALGWAVTEMLNRYKIFAEFNVKDLPGYNHMAAVNEYVDENDQPMLKMPQIVIIIDELADLMMAAPNEVEDSICRLAQMARAAGMHLVVATQRPTVDVVTGLIKANIPSRIAFAVSSTIDSRTILDSTGAEKLLGQGDMLFSPVGVHKPTRIQGCYVSESEIESIVDFVKKSRTIEYDEKIIEGIEKNAVAEPTKSGDKQNDD